MATRVRVIKKKVGSSIPHADDLHTDDIGAQLNANLFNAHMAYEKTIRMCEIMLNAAHAIETFAGANLPFRGIDNFGSIADSYRKTADQYKTSVRELFSLGANAQPTAVMLSDRSDEYKQLYDAFLACDAIRMLICTCDTLAPFKVHIADADKLSGRFLETLSGTSFIPFASFDVKDAYLQAQTESERYIISILLHKLYTYGLSMYNEFISPDMDIEHLSHVVRDAIVTLRRVPELSRCGDAFNMIEESLDMLHDNFSEYYGDFAQTRNPRVIFENFIIDVSKKRGIKHGRRATIASQFTKIINYYREKSVGHPGMGDAKSLFDHFASINAKFGIRNLGAGK